MSGLCLRLANDHGTREGFCARMGFKEAVLIQSDVLTPYSPILGWMHKPVGAASPFEYVELKKDGSLKKVKGQSSWSIDSAIGKIECKNWSSN